MDISVPKTKMKNSPKLLVKGTQNFADVVAFIILCKLFMVNKMELKSTGLPCPLFVSAA